MPSLAETQFKTIIDHPTPADYLKSWVITSNTPTFEEDWREFKGMPVEDNLKEIWSKCLSALANTEGGVLVWGIDARPTERVKGDPTSTVDAATGLRLIPNVANFKSRLMQLLAESTDPPLSGVRIETIPETESVPSGFVVCLIPESNEKPVQALHVKNKPYYLRSGAMSRIANRALLRSLFFPQTRADINIYLDYYKDPPNTVQTLGRFYFKIDNSGPATADDITIFMLDQSRIPLKSIERKSVSGEMQAVTPDPDYMVRLPVIHPGETDVLIFTGMYDFTYNPSDNFQFLFRILARDRLPESLLIKMGYVEIRGHGDTIIAKRVSLPINT